MPIGHGASLGMGCGVGKSALHKGSPPGETEGQPDVIPWSRIAQKSLVTQVLERPYRKPPLVGTPHAEKVFETTLVKELGKLTP